MKAAAGDVTIDKELIGHIHYPKTFTGDVLVKGNVTSTGLFKTGDNISSETHTGNVTINQDLAGEVLIHGNMSGTVRTKNDQTGDVTIDEDLSGFVIVEDSLANIGFSDGGRITVSGESSGDIQVGENTGSNTLIHVVDGIGTGATVEVNTTRGAFDAAGDIMIGHPTVITAIVFDGCIRIYDDGSGGDGDLTGSIDVNGCHGDEEVLVICIDGDDNGNVTLDQTGCSPANADWGCPSPGCP